MIVDNSLLLEALTASEPHEDLLSIMDRTVFHAPYLLNSEFNNGLRQLLLAKKIDEETAEEAREDLPRHWTCRWPPAM
ncbi:hypothetical protein [Nonomuraea sp. 10N515B]|uniref:hypothetical protein n=1 Tax=Nonomuraea sp. 10N515B TaxID=3457422 RepID=UPI003FCEA934